MVEEGYAHIPVKIMNQNSDEKLDKVSRYRGINVEFMIEIRVSTWASRKAKKERIDSEGLETVESALLFLLVEGGHPLLELGPGGFGFAAGASLLFNGLEGHALGAALLAKSAQLFLQLPRLLLPSLAVGLDFVALRFEITKSLLQCGGELLLSVEMLLNGADARFLFLNNLTANQLLASVSGARWRRGTVGSGGNGGKRRKGNGGGRRRKRGSGRALAEIRCERAASVVRGI